MSKYPEHEKLKELKDLPYDLVDFLDWLHDKGYVLAKEHIGGAYDEYTYLRETPESHVGIVYQYLGLNEEALLQETRQLIQEFREQLNV